MLYSLLTIQISQEQCCAHVAVTTLQLPIKDLAIKVGLQTVL